MRVAVIGAGMAGLSCADALAQRGMTVALFDKGRGPGGRMSTRRVDVDGRKFRFDHGAQYFTVRDPAFGEQVARWADAGTAARWPEAGAEAWVGTPGMNAPVKAMAEDHNVAWGTRIDAVERDGAGWRLAGAAFDALIVAVPAEQAAPLLAPYQPDFAGVAAATLSAPCWTAMIAFAEPVSPTHIVRDAGPIGWAARDGSKPGRGDAETWVVQANPEWSAAHLEQTPEAVAPLLVSALETALGTALPEPLHLAAHRWRYARSGTASGAGALWDPALKLGVCGDWLIAPRVESAWASGRRLAALIA